MVPSESVEPEPLSVKATLPAYVVSVRFCVGPAFATGAMFDTVPPNPARM